MNVLEEREDEMKTHPCGFDFGHTETGAVLILKGKQVRCTIPTAFYRVDATAFGTTSTAEGIEEREKGKAKAKAKSKSVESPPVQHEGEQTLAPALEPDKVIIQLQGESMAYAFGHYALEQTKDPWTGRGDHLRYASSYAVRGLLAISALMQPEKEYGLYVVAGIPADYYFRFPELRKQIKAKLDGTYTFTLDGETWRTAHVEVATVVMEGAGALIAYHDLDTTKEAAVIDIGGGTTDLYAQNGAKPIDKYCKGEHIAVQNATNILKKAFTRTYKRDLTDKEARDIMRAFASGKKSDFPNISTFGTPVPVKDLQEMVEEAVNIIAEDIVGFIGATWQDAIARFVPILLIGGGTYYFFDAVKNRIEHVVEHPDPVFANPIGYATLAARKLRKRLEEAAAVEKAKAVVVEAECVVVEAAQVRGLEAGAVGSQE